MYWLGQIRFRCLYFDLGISCLSQYWYKPFDIFKLFKLVVTVILLYLCHFVNFPDVSAYAVSQATSNFVISMYEVMFDSFS